MAGRRRALRICLWAGLLIAAGCALYNLTVAFFPINWGLAHDEAEHLHVAYLMSQGQRPFVDFIENHPMLFNHFLWWLKNLTHSVTVRQWAFAARVVIFMHFWIAVILIFVWLSSFLEIKQKRTIWLPAVLIAISVPGYFLPNLASLWHIRPDWISFAYTLAGLFLFYRSIISRSSKEESRTNVIRQILGGVFLGLGLAILSKGMVLVIGLAAGIFVTWLAGIGTFPKASELIKLTKRTVIFGSIAGITFVLMALLDCHLSHISMKTWYAGTVVINSLKHVPVTNIETNPINTITSIFSLNLITAVFLGIWLIYQGAILRGRAKNRPLTILIISIFVIAANLIISPFSNGVTWMHYFIPTAIAVFMIFSVLAVETILAGMNFVDHRSSKDGIILILGVVLMIVPLSRQVFEAYPTAVNRAAVRTDPRISRFNDYFIDSAIPPGLTCLDEYPSDLPILSKHWGYFFMLAKDAKIWKDLHKIGLAPEPDSYLRAKFQNSPPDLIMLPGTQELFCFVAKAYESGNAWLGWLYPEIKKNYTLMSLFGQQLYVRSELTGVMKQKGWKIAASDPYSIDGPR